MPSVLGMINLAFAINKTYLLWGADMRNNSVKEFEVNDRNNAADIIVFLLSSKVVRVVLLTALMMTISYVIGR